MEILHFCPSRSFSGLEQYAIQMATEQKRAGRQVGFVVCPGSPLEDACRKAEIKTILYNPYEMFGTLKFWSTFSGVLRTEQNLKIIHLHSTQELFHVSVPALRTRFGRHPGPKIILQSHIWVNHRKKDVFHRALYSLVNEVWCSSERQKESLLAHLPVAPAKIRVINYGRDVEKMETGFLPKEDARRVLRLPQEATVIGTVSRIEESKGIREFFEAAESLMEEWKNLHVVAIGGPSPENPEAALYTSKLENWLAGLDETHRKRFHLLGTIPDSYKFLRSLDLYVLPSYQETFSLALLDAQLAGLPVAGTEAGGTPDVVREGLTGWLFAPKDVAAMGEKLRQALLCRDQWEPFGQRAATRVRAEFNQKNISKDILKAYGLPHE